MPGSHDLRGRLPRQLQYARMYHVLMWGLASKPQACRTSNFESSPKAVNHRQSASDETIVVNMQMSLNSLPRQHVRAATAPRQTCCFRSACAVAATAQEIAPAQQLNKPAPHGRLYNFAAGPAVLPVEVLEEAQDGLLNWKGSGTSVMEMSHRGKEFSSIIQQAEDDLRSLLKIPDNYQVSLDKLLLAWVVHIPWVPLA